MKNLLAFLALIAGAGTAHATPLALSIIINGPPSVSMTCPLASSYTAGTTAVAIGATICTISVLPANWSGALTLSGPDAASFALNGLNLDVAATALAARTYSVTINAAP